MTSCYSYLGLILIISCALASNTIKFGRTWTSTFGSPQTFYAINQDQGYRTWSYAVNASGGITINGTQYFIEEITYDDGADCETMNILYERLITVDQVHVLFAPVTYECESPALIAENYSIPFINAADYTLPILQATNSTWANLMWTFTANAEYTTAGQSCVYPIWQQGARTFIGFYVVEIPGYVPEARQAALSLNMTELQNLTVLSLASIQDAVSGGCQYLDPFIETWKDLDPDFLIGTASVNTSTLVDCMNRKLWHPRALWLVTPPTFPTSQDWEALGYVQEDIWVPFGNYTDPIFGSIDQFNALFQQLWNVTGDLGYQATIATSGTMAAIAIEKAQSLDPYKIREQLLLLNMTTILGQVTLNPGTQSVARPYTCIQQISETKQTLIYPNVSETQNAIYPWKFVYPPSFLNSLKSHGLSNSNKNWIIIGCILGFFLVAGLVVAVTIGIIKWKYHTIFIAKEEGAGNEWE
jgi:ABC-type branched-subunit amino acid transport system substrate-binding protein